MNPPVQIGLFRPKPAPAVEPADLDLSLCSETDAEPPPPSLTGGPVQPELFAPDPWRNARTKKKKTPRPAPALGLTPLERDVQAWKAVVAECPLDRSAGAHAGLLHLVAQEDRVFTEGPWKGLPYRTACGVRCVPWTPLLPGQRATDAWIQATAGISELVPGAEPAKYPPVVYMPFEVK